MLAFDRFLSAPKDWRERTAIALVGGDRGVESFLQEQALQRILHERLGKSPPTGSIRIVQGPESPEEDSEFDLPGLASDLTARSLFSDGPKLVVVRRAGRLLGTQAELFTAFLQAASPPAAVVLLADRLDGRTKVARLLESRGTVVDCGPLKDSEAVRWATDRAPAHGLTLARDAAERLVQKIGPSLGLLDQEMEKVRCYRGSDGRAVREDVDAIVSDLRHAKIFDVSDALYTGRAGDAQRAVAAIFESGMDKGPKKGARPSAETEAEEDGGGEAGDAPAEAAPEKGSRREKRSADLRGAAVMLVGYLARQFRLMARAAETQARGGNVQRELESQGLAPFPAQKLARYVGDHPRAGAEAAEATRALRAADAAVKTEDGDPRAVAVLMMARLSRILAGGGR